MAAPLATPRNRLELYETAGCHLCDEAYALLLRLPDTLEIYDLKRVEISGSDELLNRYGLTIPVIRRLDTDTELAWPFDERMLAHFLE